MDDNVSISGLTFELNVFYILEKFKSLNQNILVVTNSLYEANNFYANLKTYTNDVLLFPMDDFLTSVALAISPDLKIKRLETLDEVNNNSNKIVITNLTGYLKYISAKEETNRYLSKIKIHDNIKRDAIVSTLDHLGYTRESIVTSTGEYALRGYIIDVFLLHSEHPIRIEMFGDEIESIRYFNETTQLSITKLEEVNLKAFAEIETNNHITLFDYLNNPYVIYYNYDQIKAGYEKLENEMFEYKKSQNIDLNYQYMYTLNDIVVKNYTYLNLFNTSNFKSYNYISQEIENFNNNLDNLKEYVSQCLSKNKILIIG